MWLRERTRPVLLDELRLHYLHAHQIAVRTERDARKAARVPWFHLKLLFAIRGGDR
jgi:hypothetical protein